MKINTKFDVGAKVFYFNVEHMKLVESSIISITSVIRDSGEIEIVYGLNLVSYVGRSHELLDEVQAWFRGDFDAKHIVADEKFLFHSEKDFLKFVTTEEPKVETKVEASTPDADANGKSIHTVLLTVKDGNIKEHSEQHKGNEQVVQRGQQDY